MPFSVKDVIATKAYRTTCGSPLFADYVPRYDATAVRLLRRSGAVLLGKTNTHELALGATTFSSLFGQTRNPWNTDRVPGGSSGGSAAAVAAGLCYASLGTDGGGSIRIPSSMCGVTGLKPTYGRVSTYGIVPLHWSLEHIGPITRTAEDAAAVLSVIAGRDPRDHASSSKPVADYASFLTGDVEGLRIGCVSEYSGRSADTDVDRRFQDAIRVFDRLGAQTSEVSIPILRISDVLRQVIIGAEGATLLWEKVSRNLDKTERVARMYLQFGAMLSATDYVRAQQLRTQFILEMRKIFRTFDLLVSPATPITAPKIGEDPIVFRGRALKNSNDIFARFNGAFNITGCPAISVPCGFDSKHLPVGLQIAGRPFEDHLVLKAAHSYQTRTTWHENSPRV